MNDVTCAWLAALIDGEGSIMLNKRTYSVNARVHPKQPIYRPVVVIANTDYRLMEALMERTGINRVYEHKVSHTSKSHNPRKRRQWTWRMVVGDIRVVLPWVRPFLVLKGEQADLLLEACAIKAENTPRPGWTPDDGQRRQRMDAIYAEIRALNTRGRVPDNLQEVV